MKPLKSGGLLIGAGVGIVLAGCTALLGDFTSGTGPSGDAGGSDDAPSNQDGTLTDAPGADSPGIGDGASDVLAEGTVDAQVDAGPPPLQCSKWLYANPIVLENLSTAAPYRVSGPLTIFALTPASAHQVRVIAGKSSGIPFTVYTVDQTPATPTVTTLNPSTGSANMKFSTARRGPSAISPYTVVVGTQTPLMGSPSFSAYVLNDSLAAAGPIPSSFIYPIYQVPPTQGFPPAFHILPFSTVDLFTLVTTSGTVGGSPSYFLGAGRATPSMQASLTMEVTSLNLNDLTGGHPGNGVNLNPGLIHQNGNVYIFEENDTSSPGLSAWTVPETPNPDAAAPVKRSIESGNAALVLDIAQGSAGGTTGAADVMYQENTVMGTTLSSVEFRWGTVAYTASTADGGTTPSLDTWVSSDLKPSKTYSTAAGSSVFDAPFGITCGSVWTNDNIMLLGPGPKNVVTGVTPPGLNLLWVDASGAIKSEMTGSNNNILSTLSDFTGAAAAPISISATSAKWAVAWVEAKTNDAGLGYDVISYNELDCQ